MKKVKRLLSAVSLFLLLGLGNIANVSAIEENNYIESSVITSTYGPATYYYDVISPRNYGYSKRVVFIDENGYMYSGTVYRKGPGNRYVGTLYNQGGYRLLSDLQPK